MQHLKNIRSGNPKTVEQYQLTKNFDVIWLFSDDGKNWYEEVRNFQEDTIKIVYDENNIIVAITKDASTLNPDGFSVVEVPDITANRRADDSGKWMFKDGAVIKRVYTEEEQLLQAEKQKQKLLQQAREKTQFWQIQLALGIITDSDKQQLMNWMKYVQQVEATDTSTLPVTFPEHPE
ncbi:tail fiber assembly protein [Escherichia ruysiae]|uniref:Tail fiber assembly protein n=1 Tax=Escherichia ruysiae TaxID=2608867 RepID=A0ABU1DYC0_9ESCH|nr:tail fiber assembly protein [Escherichia ruysiae]EFC0652528.1 tail fiber assembly protein [Escherichia coli]EFC1529328.1 tail fiber assembly protein [Escherichia coli]EFC9528715.1 tail fiber assembly protein [Escherichia coli]MDR4881004.1 tail fiber assembly protein [Escherichia ruysiae]MDR4909402.1 tail fiber assembly protein [Escherichia ruysiae]